MFVHPVVVIEGRRQFTIGAAGQSEPLPSGVYAVWAEADTHIKVATTASDVTAETGYLVRTGETVHVRIARDDLRIGAVAECFAHRVG